MELWIELAHYPQVQEQKEHLLMSKVITRYPQDLKGGLLLELGCLA